LKNSGPSNLDADIDYPLVIRPVGSHAGRGLEKLETPSDARRHLGKWQDPEFFVSEFIDYSSYSDGLLRKYRIIFVNWRAFPCHMAISGQWKIWYMNADMSENESNCDEEETFMNEFDKDFAEHHKQSLTELCGRVNLEYFGIDCAEDSESNLVLFEADNALIVHDMDE